MKQIKKLWKKSPKECIGFAISRWGEELYRANGVISEVDKVVYKWESISAMLTRIPFSKDYYIRGDWLQCCIAQVIQSEATERLFDAFKWNFQDALYPKSRGAETIEHIDISEYLSSPVGSVIVRVLLVPISKFSIGATLESKKGKLFEYCGQDRKGVHRVVTVNRYGKAMEMCLTNYQFYRLKPI